MNTKRICNLSIGIALWVVLASVLKVPLIGHIQTDLGYIVFGVYCVIFGWQAAIVGGIGCLFESLIFSGWFPIGWILGNIFIGIVCGVVLNKYKINKIVMFIIVLISVFVGIGIIKTVIECVLYQIPFEVKIVKNMIATVADMIPMYIGVVLGQIFKDKKYIKA